MSCSQTLTVSALADGNAVPNTHSLLAFSLLISPVSSKKAAILLPKQHPTSSRAVKKYWQQQKRTDKQMCLLAWYDGWPSIQKQKRTADGEGEKEAEDNFCTTSRLLVAKPHRSCDREVNLLVRLQFQSPHSIWGINFKNQLYY